MSEIVIVKEGSATSAKDLNTVQIHGLIEYLRAIAQWRNAPSLYLEPKLTGGDYYAYTFANEEDMKYSYTPPSAMASIYRKNNMQDVDKHLADIRKTAEKYVKEGYVVSINTTTTCNKVEK